MKTKIEITKTEGSTNFRFMLLATFLSMTFIVLMATQPVAFEIITKEDIVQKTVMKTDFIKTADNFIVLMDQFKILKVAQIL